MIQWFDVLQVEVDRRVESILAKAWERFPEAQQLGTPLHSDRPDSPASEHDSHTTMTSEYVTDPLPSNSCSPLLIQRCPACFGGNSYGRPLAAGADIHVATDGNFHHRHWQSAGDCPAFYKPVYSLPKAQVDAVGQRITKAHKRPGQNRHTSVPDAAVDQCESSYEAADGKKQKAAMDSFDNMGLMALICRHDIPLFFANIDTPGEQQKYSISLIEHLFSLLPCNATVTIFYDVGCVTERSLQRVCHTYVPATSC